MVWIEKIMISHFKQWGFSVSRNVNDAVDSLLGCNRLLALAFMAGPTFDSRIAKGMFVSLFVIGTLTAKQTKT